MSDNQGVDKILQSLNNLASLEREAAAAETNMFGILRDRLSPAARYGEPILTKYRVQNYQTPQQDEQTTFLTEGFPTMDGRRPMLALIAIDGYALLDLQPSEKGAQTQMGQYGGECIFLTHDRKWILAERTGTYSSVAGTTSEWEARCRVISDRVLHDRYSLEAVANGLLVTTNKIWQKVSPRVDALKKRVEKTQHVSSLMSSLKGQSRETGKAEGRVVLELLGQKISFEK